MDIVITYSERERRNGSISYVKSKDFSISEESASDEQVEIIFNQWAKYQSETPLDLTFLNWRKKESETEIPTKKVKVYYSYNGLDPKYTAVIEAKSFGIEDIEEAFSEFRKVKLGDAKVTLYKWEEVDEKPIDTAVKNTRPIGIEPEKVWLEDRLESLNNAICRYAESNFAIPEEWIKERNKLLEKIKNTVCIS